MDDFPKSQITEFHGEFPNFIRTIIGNVKVMNHTLCNCVCVLLHFDKKITLINCSNVASEWCKDSISK